jgi:fructose/tagatose bisphosphate aldolase
LDASEFSEEQNVAQILTLCEIAKAAGMPVTLEMESAVDEGITSAEETKRLLGSIESVFPDHIYLWAPGVGTKHGFGEDMNFNVKTIENNIRLTKEITGREIGIALHGSTGLSPQDLSNAAKAGVVKVNWSTESLLIRSTAARNYYLSHEEKLEKKHPEWKNTVMDNGINSYVAKEYVPKVAQRMKLLGAAGKAGELVKLLQTKEESLVNG